MIKVIFLWKCWIVFCEVIVCASFTSLAGEIRLLLLLLLLLEVVLEIILFMEFEVLEELMFLMFLVGCFMLFLVFLVVFDKYFVFFVMLFWVSSRIILVLHWVYMVCLNRLSSWLWKKCFWKELSQWIGIMFLIGSGSSMRLKILVGFWR